MLFTDFILQDFWCYDSSEHTDTGPQEQLYIEQIRPEDLPQKDWPEPEPNKRVIIIDI